MKTLGQIAHDAGKFDRQWHQMGEGQKADWERIAQAVIDAQQVAVPQKYIATDEFYEWWGRHPDLEKHQALNQFYAAPHPPQGDKL